MSLSNIEYYTELSLLLSYRDEKPAVFTNMCKVLDRCLRFRGILSPLAPAVDYKMLVDMLEQRRFGALCVCPDDIRPLAFVWGRVELYENNIILGVDHMVCSVTSQAEELRRATRFKMMRDLVWEYANAHFGVYPLESDPTIMRQKVYWVQDNGGQRTSVRLGRE